LSYAGAKPLVATLLEQHPDDDDLHAIRALILLWTGDLEGARTYVRRRLRIRKSAAVAAVAAEIAWFLNRTDHALRICRNAEHLDSCHFLVLRVKAALASSEGDDETAAAIWQRSLDLYPENPNAYSALVQAAGMLDLEIQDRMLAGAPAWFIGSAQYYARRGIVALQRASLDKAIEDFRQEVALCPTNSSSWAHLANALRAAGKFDEAGSAATIALDLNSRNPVAMRVMAGIARQKGNTREANEWVRRAAKAAPVFNVVTHLMSGNEMLRKGDKAGAIREYRKATQNSRPIVEKIARISLIKLLVLEKQHSEARDELLLAREMSGADPRLDVLECSILVAEGKEFLAGPLIEKLLYSNPTPPEVYSLAIQYYASAENWAQLDMIFDTVLSQLPGFPASIGASVSALWKVGRKEQARELLQAALRRYPADRSLRLIDARFISEGGDKRSALRIYRKLLPNFRPKSSKTLRGRILRVRRYIEGLFKPRRGG